MSALEDALTGYDWAGSKKELEGLARKYAPQLLELAYEESGTGISFDLSNPRIKDTIDGLAKRIVGVADTTREDVKRWVEIGTEEGLSVDKIAEQIRSKAADISPARALTIARTETATAHSLGSLLAYGDAGVSKVEVLDGDEDEDCAAANGQIWSIEKAEAEPIAHPNCTRAFAPVLED